MMCVPCAIGTTNLAPHKAVWQAACVCGMVFISRCPVGTVKQIEYI